MSLVHSVFIVSNILGTISIFKLITIFFERENINQYIELLSYFIYYILSVLFFIIYPVPVVLLLFNIISIFTITLNYGGTLKRHITATVYVYLIIFGIEIVCMSLFEYKKIFIFKIQELHSVYLIICVKVLVYIISLILSERKLNIKKLGDISVLYWIGVVSIPVSSLVIMVLFLNIAMGSEQLQILIALIFITIINIVSFQLYNQIVSIMQERNKKIVLHKQGESYLQQLKMIQINNENISLIRHDIQNHLFMLKSLYEKGEIDSYQSYFDTLLSKINKKEEVCKSGNLVVDSIINYKLRNINNINLYQDVCIPKKLEISDVDMTVVLGDLLDNAVRAVKESDRKELKINLKYKKGRLILQIENSYKNIVKSQGKLQTTKKEKQGHGIGLESVREVAERYNGILQIDYVDKMFIVVVILYC